MNNGYQKSNGCGADKEGGKIFNTFFYPELQSKHVRPLATNGRGLAKVGIKKYQSSNLAQKLIESTNAQFSTKAPLLPNPCVCPA